MSSTPLETARATDARRAAYSVALCLALAVGLALATPVLHASVPFSMLVAGGVAILALLGLAVARYDLAVALGFALLGFVRFEPAPSDAVFAIVVAVAVATGRLRLDRVPFVPAALVGLLIAVSALSIGTAVDFSLALRFFTISLYLGVFFVWLIGYVDSHYRARVLVVAYLVAALVSAVLGSLPFLFPFSGLDLFTTEGGFRAQALFKDPNVYGPFLVPAALILVDEIISPRLILLQRWVKSLLVLVLLTGLLFSYSRAAWFSFGFGLFVLLTVLLLRRTSAGRLKVIITSLVASVVLLAPLAAMTGATGVIEDRARFQAYDVQRFQAQREGLNIGMTHPLGVGPGQFDYHAVAGAHSLYIRVFAEQGPVGLVVLLLFIALTFGVAAANTIRGIDTFGIGSAVLFAAFCGLLVTSVTVDTLHWRHLWVLAALIWVGWRRGASASSRSGSASV
jgi:O-antigen ligase/polysaccharide polymerase Wzy-like membrane protein